MAAPEPEVMAAPEPEVMAAPEPKPALKTAISEARKTKKYKEKYKEFKAVLGADPIITMPGPPGRLKVWIGIPAYNPNFPKVMKQVVSPLPAVGTTARVTPLAPAFKVEPKESICMKIDPTGSEVSFTLTPTRGGTFDVGADVCLYDSINCSGAPIPKGTTILQVQVVVRHILTFYEVFWETLLKFWGELLALLFAVMIFLIRKQLKRWIGFGKDN